MKKSFLIATATIAILSSCKKNYTCECAMTYTGATTSSKTITLESNTKLSKKDATTWCEENNYTSSGATSKCTLK
jgi:hypothetical protein